MDLGFLFLFYQFSLQGTTGGINCLLKSPATFFDYENLLGHMQFYLVGVDHLQIDFCTCDTIVEKIEFVHSFFNKVGEISVRVEIDGLGSYLHGLIEFKGF